jgi:hypothetical protein
MPQFVERERVTFEIAEGEPVLRLDVSPPSPSVLDADGWSALVKRTLVVADGPSETGYLVRRVGHDLADAAPEGWEEAARRKCTITVVFGNGHDATRRKMPLVE